MVGIIIQMGFVELLFRNGGMINFQKWGGVIIEIIVYTG
jgi:hypothetical protein